MQAMDIANDALDSVLGDIKVALRISIPVLLLNIIIIAILGYSFWQALFSGNEREAQAILESPFGTAMVIFVPVLVVFSVYWITVAWHRFVILDEQPTGILPKLYLGSIWAYIWRLLVLAFVVGIVVVLPLTFISGIIGGGGKINIADYSEALQVGLVAVIFNMVGTAAFAYAFMRYSPFLVAAAVGAPIRAATGRESTYWAKKPITLLAIGYAVMSLVTTFVGGGLSTGFWPVDLAIVLALQWVAFMFTISLLTTLYQKSVAYYSDNEETDRIIT